MMINPKIGFFKPIAFCTVASVELQIGFDKVRI
uniref:Uncharacterized protein n=1 Tax=Rhizophora mucronata TaxID=61149 RepID=A0A2P2NU56_RHIMU